MLELFGQTVYHEILPSCLRGAILLRANVPIKKL